MFNEHVGGQVAWLLPFAAVALLAGLWFTRRAARTDLRRAGLVLFGVWAIVHVAVFSAQQGIFHPYYVSALAPAVTALTGFGIVALVRWTRDSWAGMAALALGVGVSACVAVMVLDRTPDFAPALRTLIPAAAALAVLAAVAVETGKGDAARQDVAEAAKLASPDLAATVSPWVFWRLVRAGVRAGVAEQAEGVARAIADPVLRGRAQLEVLRGRLAATQGPADESLAQTMDKNTPAHGLALEALARHNARFGSASAVQKAVDGWDDERLRPFGYIGVALGLQDKTRA
jgi:4-amino-4-deoxy-L-arabinose transferase-like glycosyltransferase